MLYYDRNHTSTLICAMALSSKRTIRRKAPASRKARKLAARRRITPKPKPDPLDGFIVAAAKALDLPAERRWLPAIKANLRVTLQHAATVAEFTLPDDAEPAPVFRA